VRRLHPTSASIIAVVLLVWLGGQAVAAAPKAPQNLAYHGGPVLRQDTNYAIFWEPPYLQNGDPTHVSDSYNHLVERYFRDVGGSGLYRNNTQYYRVRNGRKEFIEDVSVLGGTWLDASPYPASGCSDSFTPGNCLSDRQLQHEVAKAMKTNGWTGGYSHMFFVFTSYGEGSCVTSRLIPGCAFVRYCAWHNFFHADGTTVVYANQPYPGTSIGMCGAPASPNHDPDADATLSLVSHEQMEAVTDPTYRGWWTGDQNTGEIADICYTWGTLDEDGGKANQVWNGHYYVLQEEWSNVAGGCVQEGP
jgi:hypothetical protein